MAAAVDWRGTLVDEKSFATTRQGYRQLESWARSLGDVLRVGVECSGSYGSGLTRHLAKNGFTVLEVTFPDKTVRRKRAERTTSSTPRWPLPRPRSPAPGR